MSKNPDARFSVRIQRLSTGAWTACGYSPTLHGALEAAHKQPVRDYVWAVFDGRTKVVDCRGWSGDIDFECEVYARDSAGVK